MNSKIKNVLAVIVGWLGGSIVNMQLIKMGHSYYPIEGLNMEDPKYMDMLAEVMPTLGNEFFIFPFLAHALGTLIGAFIAGIMAVSNKMKFALGIGVLFLIGGIMVNVLLPGPLWFTALDIVVAYLPMAWLGGFIAQKIQSK